MQNAVHQPVPPINQIPNTSPKPSLPNQKPPQIHRTRDGQTRIHPGRNILSQSQQQSLVSWALRKLAKGQRMMRTDLARKAIKMSQGKEGFKATKGWSNKFLRRHPELKREMQKVSRFNLGVRGHVLVDSEEEEEEGHVKEERVDPVEEGFQRPDVWDQEDEDFSGEEGEDEYYGEEEEQQANYKRQEDRDFKYYQNQPHREVMGDEDEEFSSYSDYKQQSVFPQYQTNQMH